MAEIPYGRAAAPEWRKEAWRDAAFMDPGVQAGLREAARRIEIAVLFACLLVFAQALTVFLPANELAEDQPLLRALWYPIYLFALAGALVQPVRVARMALLSGLGLLPLAMVALSVFWSIEPDITFRRAIALIFTTVFGLYLAARFDWRGLLVLLAVLWGVMAAAALVTALAFPSRGIMSEIHPGAWSGLWSEKNEMGAMMARGALLFAALLVLYSDLRRKAWVWAGLGLCAGLVLMSTSKTSLLALLSIPAAMIAIAALRRGAVPAMGFLCAAALGLVLLAGLMVWDLDLVFEMLGRERSLTGRTDIWDALFRSISERPWLGYGYGVFWRGEWGPAFWVRQATQWAVPTAHNGWLETALSIGLIGVALTALYVFSALGAALLSIRRRPEVYFALPAIGLTLLFSFSESIILQHNNINWVVFVALAAKLFAGDFAGDSARRGAAPGRAGSLPVRPVPPASQHAVSTPLTLFRVTLRPGASMIDLSADLAGLAAGLDRTRPADGRGRVIMFTAPRAGAGVSLLAREFARMMARRAPRGVWLFDLDLSRNEHFRAFTSNEARRRYGPIGPALDATLGQDPFWRVTSGKPEEDGRAESISALLTLHRVGATRLFVSRFHPELLSRGKRVHIRAAHSYWERLRDTVELAVIDAPATERSFAGRPLYAEADAVVIVVDETEDSMREAEYLAEAVRDRGGLPAGVIVNMAEPQEDYPAQRAG